MSWDAGLQLRGNSSSIALSATDISSDSACGRFLALKARPAVRAMEWERKFASWGAIPFPIADVRQLTENALRLDPAPTPADLPKWIRVAIEARGVHRLLRKFVAQAVENAVDAHYEMEHSVGELKLLAIDPEYGPRSRTLKVWAHLYQTADGVREIRRYRLGAAHNIQSPSDTRWSTTAGFIAAKFVGENAPTRVRVVEVGLLDGSSYVAIDVSPQDAIAAYLGDTRPHAVSIVDATHVVPCRSCSECKIAGTCTDLIPVRSMIEQPSRGLATRSVSASELAEYAECPAKWLLNRQLHLPRKQAVTPEQDRGLSVHRWLARAHDRGVPCTLADIEESAGGRGLAEGILTAEQFTIAEPFLMSHLEACAFANPDCALLAVEKTFYGFDGDADVLPVLKPDLVYWQQNQLIVRETKTSLDAKVQTRDEAYDKYIQVPFALQMLKRGLLEQHGAEAGAVELELLTPVSQHIWRWDTNNPILAAVAAGDVRRAAEDWHVDASWETQPGPQCEWCPVSEWCPDSEVYSLRLQPNAGLTAVTPQDDESAPF